MPLLCQSTGEPLISEKRFSQKNARAAQPEWIVTNEYEFHQNTLLAFLNTFSSFLKHYF